MTRRLRIRRRNARANSSTPGRLYAIESDFDVVQVVERIVQGMLKEAPDIASRIANRQTTGPIGGARSIGYIGQ